MLICIFLPDSWQWKNVCSARLKFGFSETLALNLSGFPVNYRCFTLELVKLLKLWPQFVKVGGKGEGATYKSRVWIQHRGASCAAWWACAVSPEHFIISVTDQEGHYCFPNVLVCVCLLHASWHTPCVCAMHAEEGWGGSQCHGVVESAPCREETGFSLRKAGNFLFWGQGIQRTLS